MSNDLPSNDGNVSVSQQDDKVDSTLNVTSGAVGGVAKEQVESRPLVDVSEKVPIVETREVGEVSKEVSSWMDKLEQGEEVSLPQSVSDDDGVVLEPVGEEIDEEVVVLPMTEEQVKQGLHKRVYNSARWLAEWCVRLAKKLHGKVMYLNSDMEQG